MTGTRESLSPPKNKRNEIILLLDYLHREIFLEEEDIQTVPESGRADDACSAIAEKPYVVEQFMADSFRTLKDVASRLCDSPDIKSRHDALMYIVWRVALDIKEWRTLSHSEAAVKVTREDGFVWLLVSAENARKLWEADVFSCTGFMPMIRNP